MDGELIGDGPTLEEEWEFQRMFDNPARTANGLAEMVWRGDLSLDFDVIDEISPLRQDRQAGILDGALEERLTDRLVDLLLTYMQKMAAPSTMDEAWGLAGRGDDPLMGFYQTEFERCLYCEDCLTALTPLERDIMRHKLSLNERTYKNDADFRAQHGLSHTRFTNAFARAKQKLIACIQDQPYPAH